MAKYADLFRPNSASQAVELPVRAQPKDTPCGNNGYTLLFVDDEKGVLQSLKRIFLDENYQILTAANGPEALDMLQENTIHLVVSDHRMPGMTGAELLKEVKERWPQTIRIMLTGYADVQSVMGAVNEGAVYKFITKPWSDEDLRLTVSLALQQYALLQENKKLKTETKIQQETIKNFSTLVGENNGVLASLLAGAGLVEKEDFSYALRQRQGGEFITDTLVRLGMTTESRIVKALQDKLQLEYVDLKEMHLNAEVVRLLPKELCEKTG